MFFRTKKKKGTISIQNTATGNTFSSGIALVNSGISSKSRYCRMEGPVSDGEEIISNIIPIMDVIYDLCVPKSEFKGIREYFLSCPETSSWTYQDKGGSSDYSRDYVNVYQNSMYELIYENGDHFYFNFYNSSFYYIEVLMRSIEGIPLYKRRFEQIMKRVVKFDQYRSKPTVNITLCKHETIEKYQLDVT